MRRAGSMSSPCSKASVSIPDLLLYDEGQNVLIILDLGLYPKLTNTYVSWCGSDLYGSSASIIGARVGMLFANLHSSATRDGTMSRL